MLVTLCFKWIDYSIDNLNLQFRAWQLRILCCTSLLVMVTIQYPFLFLFNCHNIASLLCILPLTVLRYPFNWLLTLWVVRALAAIDAKQPLGASRWSIVPPSPATCCPTRSTLSRGSRWPWTWSFLSRNFSKKSRPGSKPKRAETNLVPFKFNFLWFFNYNEAVLFPVNKFLLNVFVISFKLTFFVINSVYQYARPMEHSSDLLLF